MILLLFITEHRLLIKGQSLFYSPWIWVIFIPIDWLWLHSTNIVHVSIEH
jgi:hypothetical protein